MPTSRGCGDHTAFATDTGLLYNVEFETCASDDYMNVYATIRCWINQPGTNGGGPYYYDCFLMRWNGSAWVKAMTISGNILTGETKNRQFSNIVESGTPTMLWTDFYLGSQYLGHHTTPSWVR